MATTKQSTHIDKRKHFTPSVIFESAGRALHGQAFILDAKRLLIN